MSSYKKKRNLYDTEEGAEIIKELKKMAIDEQFNTGSTYSSDIEHYPDNAIPFVDKHIKYLNSNQNINPQHYLANLRLMSRIK